MAPPPRREEEIGIPGTGVATISPAFQSPTPLAVGNDAVFKIQDSEPGSGIGAVNTTVKGLVINY